ncbi:hypothetical protein [Nocardia ignorata]|nr:hypothetical protein [Nocardia ignorata]
MSIIADLPHPPRGHAPAVRPAYNILSRTHASVKGLFSAVDVLDETRRNSNATTKGRMSRVEVDVLRSAVVLTSAGLDSTMKRLVNDAGRTLISKAGSAARKQYEEFLKNQLSQPTVTPTFRDAVIAPDVADRLLAHYMNERTRASFQGSRDLKRRVRNTLGLSGASVTDADLESLDAFFLARNKIVHDLDLEEPASDSLKRVHRTRSDVAAMCDQAFSVAAAIVSATAALIKATK